MQCPNCGYCESCGRASDKFTANYHKNPWWSNPGVYCGGNITGTAPANLTGLDQADNSCKKECNVKQAPEKDSGVDLSV